MGKPSQWELVFEEENATAKSRMRRMRVPNGWLYLYEAWEPLHIIPKVMTFVPDPNV